MISKTSHAHDSQVLKYLLEHELGQIHLCTERKKNKYVFFLIKFYWNEVPKFPGI